MQKTFSEPLPKAKPLAVNLSASIRIAYFIMVHNEPEQFIRMFKKIYTKDQFYLIHIDRKANDEVTEKIQGFSVQFPNVYILESMNITSGGFNMVQIELNAIEFLLNVSTEWEYFINLSGEDYPLKSQTIIRKFLTIQNGKNYLFYYDQKFYRPDTLKRIQNHFTELAFRISSFIYKRDFMKDVVPYIGGKWMILTRDTCSFLSNSEKVMAFEDYYLHTYLPADSFFQTVLMNTSFHQIIVNDDKRAIINFSALDINIAPFIFENYLKSNNHLFIRKLKYKDHHELLQYIDENFHSFLPDISDIDKELRNRSDQNN
ncbi:beta-1,6-N-acetylglucosaminyltransferase [Chryseobacterium sp. PBS4-4]|uniref:Peptide O-xylosyltransferase n=1 Tax=Chryseobacterium edaphi TaxID=2976532 RepID=A0ABT2WDD8_9FLAO|nr:beta-1,6-N-acetylglucosaminyltransferase [Chryseobacterium edaphi]MCU7619322.1 beta-1,6-N-acetylglucosaminyltransferase [Chryseobacterium edaphi]